MARDLIKPEHLPPQLTEHLPGLLGVWQLKSRAWITEQQSEAKVRIVRAQQSVMEAYAQAAEAEWRARERVERAKHSFEAALRGEPPPNPGSLALAPAWTHSTPPETLHVHLSDREIEQLALKAVTCFASLAPEHAQEAWGRWRSEVRSRYSRYLAAEIIERASELSTLAC